MSVETRTAPQIRERPSAPAPSIAVERLQARETPGATPIDWDALAPRHAYVRLVRPLIDVALLCIVCVPALALVSIIAVANALAFRDVRQVFFVQPRIGLRGRVFKLVKFRTMSAAPQGNFESWGRGDQARVTAFGRFLRNAHLDELPQLMNVLRGEMSFIGPRPEMLEFEQWAGEHLPTFVQRLAIKPGITGLAQITQGYTGRDVDAYAEKLAINLAYLEHMSLRLDLEILARTGLWMLRGKGWDWQKQARAKR